MTRDKDGENVGRRVRNGRGEEGRLKNGQKGQNGDEDQGDEIETRMRAKRGK